MKLDYVELLTIWKGIEMNEKHPENWVKLSLLIDPDTKQMYAVGGDREPCSHGDPPCCDTKYIGMKLLEEWIMEM